MRAGISKEDDAESIAAAAARTFGRIDILVNNAADFTQKNVEAASVADWQRVLGVNVIGTALVSKFAIPYLKAAGAGSIVYVPSMSGTIAQHDFATYNSSKGAVLTMTKCMALDLAPHMNGLQVIVMARLVRPTWEWITRVYAAMDRPLASQRVAP